MYKQFSRFLSWLTPLQSSKKVFTSLSLTAGVALGSATALAVQTASVASQTQQAPVTSESSTATQISEKSLPNGVYLFGQSDKPEQLGKAYLVFEVHDSHIVGAFYMPRSSFDCVYGNFQPNQLALTVVDSYDKTTHPYSIAVQRDNPVATAGTNSAVKKLGLEGMNQLQAVSENDKRILDVCKANFPQALN